MQHNVNSLLPISRGCYPCLEIEKDPKKAMDYTSRGNLVAVISNGTAVLGLKILAALGWKPVMEGKGLLFKAFADIDVFDIEVDTEDIDEFVDTVKRIAPTLVASIWRISKPLNALKLRSVWSRNLIFLSCMMTSGTRLYLGCFVEWFRRLQTKNRAN